MDTIYLDKCRSKLREVARAGDRISYSSLAAHLGIESRGTGPYLIAIYEEEMKAGRPDITLVVVYAQTGFGRYNSHGGPATGTEVDPDNPADVRAYREQLAKVYEYWLAKPLLPDQ
jgi:hypothetical protein